jgi:surfactin synthase thioesterase subunit
MPREGYRGMNNNDAKNNAGVVYFAHGKESGPWGAKIKRLAQVAEARGFRVESPDYSEIDNPDQRVQKLLGLYATQSDNLVLVGSSMGGYVSTVASETLTPRGLFLIAPAFYMGGYANQNPFPNAALTAIVHGWKDEVIPVEHSIRFAQKYNTELHLVDGDHRLIAQIPFIEGVFGLFLDRL